EFPFRLYRVLGSSPSGIHRLSASSLSSISVDTRQQIFTIIEKMGMASAKAQGLRSVITTPQKFIHSDHVIYLATFTNNADENAHQQNNTDDNENDSDSNNGNRCTGLLRVGRKSLFIRVLINLTIPSTSFVLCAGLLAVLCFDLIALSCL